MKTSDRKKDHVSLTVSGEVDYDIPTGFEQFRFKHNALPEVNFNEIDTTTTLLGRSFDFPLFISSMTGGYREGGSVNSIIAEFCEQNNLPFGVGSQRVALEEPDTRKSFEIVRKKAPTAFIASNIGGCQLIGNMAPSSIRHMTEMIEADAIIVHLNPLQELMQPEGDKNFEGITKGIEHLINTTLLPVIVKETGGGISGEVGKKLIDLGVSVVDIAGAGGTSWSKVENKRNIHNNATNELFDNWGIPTVQCLLELSAVRQNSDVEIIASGGIKNSFDIAKALCLGANFTAMAQPVIKAVMNNGLEGMNILFNQLKKQVTTIMCLSGAKKISDLNNKLLVRVG